MNQQQFNHLVELYIKIQAAQKVFQDNYTSVEPFRLKWHENRQNKDLASERLNALKENEKILDEKLNDLDKQLSTIPKDAQEPYRTQNLYEKISVILTQKALLQCEMMYLENELAELKDQLFLLLESPDFRGEAIVEKAGKQANDYREALKKEMFHLWRVEHPELDDPELLQFIEKDILFTPTIELCRDFIEHLNNLYDQPFDYRTSYKELLMQVAASVNDKHWTDSKDSFTRKKIQEIQAILEKQDSFPAEKIYLELQKKAKQIGLNTGNKSLNTLCAGIIEKNSALIQSLGIEFGILNEVDKLFEHRFHTREKENLAKKITPRLVQNVEQTEFNQILDLFLCAQAGQQIAKETLASVQSCIKEIHALEQQILQLENHAQKLVELEKTNTEKRNNFKDYVEKRNSEPDNPPSRFEREFNEQTLKQHKVNLDFTKSAIRQNQSSLQNIRREYNHLLSDHNSAIHQALVLSQFAAQFERQYIAATGLALKRTHPGNEQIEDERWTEFVHGYVTATDSLPESLGHFMKATKSDYEMSYDAFLQKIREIVKHPYWIQFKQNQGETKGVEELARILNKLNQPGTEKDISLLQKTAAKFIKKSPGFFEKKSSTENHSATLYQAIVDKDILALDKLLLRFDFAAEQEERFSLRVDPRF